jgi:hypothetical protein
MFSRWIVTNITSASVTTFLAFLAGIISWSVYCTEPSAGTWWAYGELSMASTFREARAVIEQPRGLRFGIASLLTNVL